MLVDFQTCTRYPANMTKKTRMCAKMKASQKPINALPEVTVRIPDPVKFINDELNSVPMEIKAKAARALARRDVKRFVKFCDQYRGCTMLLILLEQIGDNEVKADVKFMRNEMQKVDEQVVCIRRFEIMSDDGKVEKTYNFPNKI